MVIKKKCGIVQWPIGHKIESVRTYSILLKFKEFIGHKIENSAIY